MARILTGIQSSGRQHLGNVLGAIRPAIKMAEDEKNESFLFIADLHSLTTIKDAKLRKENVLATAAAWLACGLNTDRSVFYRQSDVEECTELTWYLSCFTPYPMMANAHSFKDKSNNLSDVNAGLFVYPVLMASDIILYDADIVPVGKDQKQHLEMTRDIANTFNNKCGETFVIPEASISEDVMIIPGTDGRKMSKSYNNFIDIFLSEKQLKKQVMNIITDSTPLEEPKNPDTCNVFALYKLLGTDKQNAAMREKYLAGGYGFGHAKLDLLSLILEEFKEERIRFNELMNSPDEIELALQKGAEKARPIAQKTLQRVREKLGY